MIKSNQSLHHSPVHHPGHLKHLAPSHHSAHVKHPGHLHHAAHLRHPGHLHHAGHLRHPGHSHHIGHLRHPGHLHHAGHLRHLHGHPHLNLATAANRTNINDWRSLNRLIKVADNFKPLKSTTIVPGQNAAFRITMKDNKPVFAQRPYVKPVSGVVAGVVYPKTFTRNNSGKRTTPYLYIKVPIKGLRKPGGAVFVPPVSGKKKSHVDVLTWKNQIPSSVPGSATGVIHPEKQFLYWLKQQSAKDPNFAARIQNIKMRTGQAPCVNCTKSMVRNIKGIVGTTPRISIKVNSTPHNRLRTHLLNHALRHPSLNIKTVPGGISNPVVMHKVINAIANRHVKLGTPVGRALAHANKLHTAAVKAAPAHPMHKAVAKALAHHINKAAGRPVVSAQHALHKPVSKAVPQHVVNKVVAKAVAHQLAKAAAKPAPIKKAQARIDAKKQAVKHKEY